MSKYKQVCEPLSNLVSETKWEPFITTELPITCAGCPEGWRSICPIVERTKKNTIRKGIRPIKCPLVKPKWYVGPMMMGKIPVFSDALLIERNPVFTKGSIVIEEQCGSAMKVKAFDGAKAYNDTPYIVMTDRNNLPEKSTIKVDRSYTITFTKDEFELLHTLCNATRLKIASEYNMETLSNIITKLSMEK